MNFWRHPCFLVFLKKNEWCFFPQTHPSLFYRRVIPGEVCNSDPTRILEKFDSLGFTILEHIILVHGCSISRQTVHSTKLFSEHGAQLLHFCISTSRRWTSTGCRIVHCTNKFNIQNTIQYYSLHYKVMNYVVSTCLFRTLVVTCWYNYVCKQSIFLYYLIQCRYIQ